MLKASLIGRHTPVLCGSFDLSYLVIGNLRQEPKVSTSKTPPTNPDDRSDQSIFAFQLSPLKLAHEVFKSYSSRNRWAVRIPCFLSCCPLEILVAEYWVNKFHGRACQSQKGSICGCMFPQLSNTRSHFHGMSG